MGLPAEAGFSDFSGHCCITASWKKSETVMSSEAAELAAVLKTLLLLADAHQSPARASCKALFDSKPLPKSPAALAISSSLTFLFSLPGLKA